MTRRRQVLVILVGSVLLAAAVFGGYALRATQEVRPFYAEAVQAPPEQLATAADRMETRVERLVNEPKPAGDWETVFTDEEVNGWVAMMLEDEYPDLLPPQVTEPRVAFREDRCMLGYRYRGKTLKTVISIEGAATMPERDLVAVRLERAFAGVLPLPMSKVVDEISIGAKKLGIPIQWSETGGDPVLLVKVAGALSTEEERRELERIKLRDGELVLAGSAEPVRPSKGEVAMRRQAAAAQRTVAQ